MVKGKARFQGRNRVGLVPRLESLEGRQLLAAAATQVRIREAVSGSTAALMINGTNRPDLIQIADNGSGQAGNVTVSLGDGTTYTSKNAISLIQVNGKQGNDQVSYNLTGDLVAARSLSVSLGAGDDQFLAKIDGAIETTSMLDLEAYGGAGNDNMTIAQTGATWAGTFF